MAWAWLDKPKGQVRARTFAPDWGISEAMSNGSGAMLLAFHLNCALELCHGEGSVIYARPDGENYARLGGRVAE